MAIIKINKNCCLLRANNLPDIALSILTLGLNNYFALLVPYYSCFSDEETEAQIG